MLGGVCNEYDDPRTALACAPSMSISVASATTTTFKGEDVPSPIGLPRLRSPQLKSLSIRQRRTTPGKREGEGECHIQYLSFICTLFMWLVQDFWTEDSRKTSVCLVDTLFLLPLTSILQSSILYIVLFKTLL